MVRCDTGISSASPPSLAVFDESSNEVHIFYSSMFGGSDMIRLFLPLTPGPVFA